MEWSNVTVPETGSYTLQFRYALNGPASTTRPLQLTVNGTVAATNPFPGTGTWTTWAITTNLVTLNAGKNVVRLTTIGSHGAHLDYLNVVGMSPAKPTNLTVVRGNTGTAVLTWSAAGGADGYNVERSLTSGGPYTLVGSSPTTGFTDLRSVAGTTYH